MRLTLLTLLVSSFSIGIFALGLIMAGTPVYAECRSVTIDGEEMELCDKEKRLDTLEEIADEYGFPTTPLYGDSQQNLLPGQGYQSGAGFVQEYRDGTTCVSKDINGQGLIQTDCY